MSEWTESTYEIMTKHGPEQKEGWVNGTFGLFDGNNGVEVTHLLSGRRIGQAEIPYAGVHVHKLVCDELCRMYNWDAETADDIASLNGVSKNEMGLAIDDLVNG